MRDNSTEAAVRTSLDSVISHRPVLVLSPHLDDAMLSASSIVLTHPSEVWTLFAGRPRPAKTTSWDLSCGFADSDETMTARIAEDDAAFAGTPATVRRLDAWEGAYTIPAQRQHDLTMLRAELRKWANTHPTGLIIAPVCAGLYVPPAWWETLRDRIEHRRPVADGGDTAITTADTDEHDSKASALDSGSAVEASLPASEGEQRDQASALKPANSLARRLKGPVVTAVGTVKGAIQRAMHEDAQRRRRRVIGTSGLAANPDHLVVRDLALEVLNTHPGIMLALYEDLPYLWHAEGGESLGRLARARGAKAELVIAEVDRQTKSERLLCYTSQMPVMDTQGRLLQPETLPKTERFWIMKSPQSQP